MTRQHRCIGLALAVAVAAATGCGELAERTPPVESHQLEINNGSIWPQYGPGSIPWMRNVVRVNNGCTGTLLDPVWVLTASHCFPAGTDPQTITIYHMRADSTWESRQGVEAMHHPNVSGGVDAALIRIERPFDDTVASIPLYGGDTDNLVGTSVACPGYGAIAVGATCTSSASCPAGTSCHIYGSSSSGRCLTPTDGQLRGGNFTIKADPDNKEIWYRLNVPNSLGQNKLPGDSGGPCHNGSAITGITKAGNYSDYNRDTSAEGFRSWVNGVVQPALMRRVNWPGAACKAVGGAAEVRVNTTGSLYNNAASAATVLCPVRRASNGQFANYISAPNVFVVDRSTSADVCCRVVSKNPGGKKIEGPERCSSGASSGQQSLRLEAVYDNYSWSQFSVVCTLPARTSMGSSYVLTYRVQQNRR